MNAKGELDVLLNFVLPMAHPLVERFGEFYPFGAVLDDGGVCRGVSVQPSSDRPRASEVRALLIDALRDAAAEGCRAVALCANARVAIPGRGELDAVVVSLEHKEGLTIEAAVPYSRTEDGRVGYGETRAVRGAATILARTARQ